MGVFVFLCVDVGYLCLRCSCDDSECGVLGCLEFVEICVGDDG